MSKNEEFIPKWVETHEACTGLVQNSNKVWLHDLHFGEHTIRKEWCWENDLDLIKDDFGDVSDFSYEHDTLSSFEFSNEKDALFFMLRWPDDSK